MYVSDAIMHYDDVTTHTHTHTHARTHARTHTPSRPHTHTPHARSHARTRTHLAAAAATSHLGSRQGSQSFWPCCSGHPFLFCCPPFRRGGCHAGCHVVQAAAVHAHELPVYVVLHPPQPTPLKTAHAYTTHVQCVLQHVLLHCIALSVVVCSSMPSFVHGILTVLWPFPSHSESPAHPPTAFLCYLLGFICKANDTRKLWKTFTLWFFALVNDDLWHNFMRKLQFAWLALCRTVCSVKLRTRLCAVWLPNQGVTVSTDATTRMQAELVGTWPI